MTVRLLLDYSKFKAGNLATFDAGTEAGLIAAKMADSNLSGGTAYVEPPVQTQYLPVMASTNLSGGSRISGSYAGNDSFDVVVYGATPAGVMAAVYAAKSGANVILIEPTDHLGGMLTGGLSHTDVFYVLQSSQCGAPSEDFFNEVADDYSIQRNQFFKDSYNGEPAIFKAMLQRWLVRAGVTVVFSAPILSVQKSGLEIQSATFFGIGAVAGKSFIDCGYEGDLMALAGCSYTVGREAAATYSEANAGVQAISAITNQFAAGVDPYVTPGVSASGLLPLVTLNPLATAGSADGNVQAPCYRLVLTNDPANKIAVSAAPDGYSALNYELLARHLAISPVTSMGFVFSPTGVRGNKFDFNNKLPGGLDYVSSTETLAYINGDWTVRKAIIAKIRSYTIGLLYWLGYSGDSRIPAALVTDARSYGLCKNEFGEYGNFTPQLYLREGRRMVGDFVLNQNHMVANNGLTNQIAIGYYDYDSHQVQYIIQGGSVKAEGCFTSPPGMPPANGFIIPYSTILPKSAECSNLLVVCAPSVSRVAWCSVRVEPVLMTMGAGAGVAAAIAAKRGIAPSDVWFSEISSRENLRRTSNSVLITADGTTGTAGTIAQSGAWSSGSSAFGYVGTSYLSDGNARTKTLTITPAVPLTWQYRVSLNYPAGSQVDSNRANNALVTINHASGATALTVDQTSAGQGGSWDDLGVYAFNKGSLHSIVISNAPCTNFVLFGALKLTKV